MSHPSSSLTSCTLILFCQSSNTFVSTLPSGQLRSQKPSPRATRGRICSRWARNRIARKSVVCLKNWDNSVVSFPPQREISSVVNSRLCVIKGKQGEETWLYPFSFSCQMLPKIVESVCIFHGLHLRQGNLSSDVCFCVLRQFRLDNKNESP